MPKHARRKNEDGQIDLTPMIDVVFQLIIFFIVTITMVKEYKPDIKLEMSEKGLEIVDSDPRTFVIEVDKHGWISLHGAQVTKSKLRDMLRRRYDRYGQFPIMIRGDLRTRHRDVRTVMDICTEVGVWRISFVAVKEKKT